MTSGEVLGKKRDKGVMNLPSKTLRQLAGRLEEINRQNCTIFQALIFLLLGIFQQASELIVNIIFGGVVAMKIAGKKY